MNKTAINVFFPPRLQNGVPVLLISLHDQHERRQDLVKRGIPEAWTKDYFPAHDMRKSCVQDLHDCADVVQLERKIGRPIRPAEVGCSMSHRAAAWWLAESDEPIALVLEDDVIPDAEDWIALTNTVSTALTDHARVGSAFICHLGARPGQTDPALKRRVILRDHQPLAAMPDLLLHIDPNWGLWRAHAYLISSAAAKRTDKEEVKIMTLADDWCERRSRGFIDRIFYTRPILIRQDEDRSSTIRPANHDDERKKRPSEVAFIVRVFRALRRGIAIMIPRIQSKLPYRI